MTPPGPAPAPTRGYEQIGADLEEQLLFAEADFRTLRGSRIFITGGTGFVGRWILESLLHANGRLGLAVSAAVLTRSPELFRANFPHLARNSAIELIGGDVRDLPASIGTFDGCIHAATPANAALNRDEPLEMLDTILDGGRAVLEVVGRAGKIPLLFTSTGAVYGAQPPELAEIPEDFGGGPNCLDAKNVYAEGKRIGELQCAIFAKTHGIAPKIARLFAFVGPYLPLDLHFAIGNFIADTLAQRPIVLSGDGSTVRAYQYAAEMVTWLWAVYVRGTPLRPYNIGGGEAVTTADLAHLIAGHGAPPVEVDIRGSRAPGAVVDRYVPATGRIRSELGVVHSISMRDGISRTFDFHSAPA